MTATTTHGHKPKHGPRSPEYAAWVAIKDRCYNPKNPRFSDYGGRGIIVSENWRSNFLQFLSDMGPRPGTDYSIDRKNVQGNYESGNCRWATKLEQANNRRDSRRIEFKGETKTIAEWARHTGIVVKTLQKRLRNGWPVSKALTSPNQHSHYRQPDLLT